ncbi:hypothetical protein ONE63_001802 [Megalurothrips usitatus]|uniref:Protein takeout-like n=1 Tax=Megalurothrips usitatus TaxID=439358 RepID=A0AAV7XGD1_9NEOP|nr:hypothetical protein ONE63_001802 [Megalurothrips usitatus]
MAATRGRRAATLSLVALAAAAVALLGPRPAGAVNKLPPYITACSRSDPKVSECVLKNGKNAIPNVIEGDPKYRVPKLNPMVIPELHLQQGSDAVGLKLSWKNAELHGMKDVDFREAFFDPVKRHLKMNFIVPKISITGTYTSSGRVLLLPVTGTGPSNITCENMKISYDLDWDIVKRSNGREYINVTTSHMTLEDIGFMSLKFENLFNGDRLLGRNMNEFLNENWKDLAKEFGPGVADAIGQVFRLVLKNICDIVPYDLVLKP